MPIQTIPQVAAPLFDLHAMAAQFIQAAVFGVGMSFVMTLWQLFLLWCYKQYQGYKTKHPVADVVVDKITK